MAPLEKIKKALDLTIAELPKAGSPTAALKKVAKELKLSPDFIQRTGESLNVALHHKQFKNAEKRAQDFPIADIPGVIKDIFGDEPQTKKAEWFQSSEAPKIDYETWLKNAKFKKTASELFAAKEPARNNYTFGGAYEKASAITRDLEKEAYDAQVAESGARTYVEGMFQALVRDFQKTAAVRPKFHEFETAVFNKFGKSAMPYVDLIYKGAGLKEERGAHVVMKYAQELDDSNIVLRHFDSFMNQVNAIPNLKQASEDKQNIAKQAREQLNSVFKVEKVDVVQECEKLACELELIKEADVLSRAILQDMIKRYQDAGSSKKTPAFKNNSSDNTERIHLLQDLIMTDPILAKQDPKKIVSAYQQVLRLAPQMAQEKEIVRSILRQLTATQSLAPVEGNQLIEANTNFLKQRQLLNSTESSGDKRK